MRALLSLLIVLTLLVPASGQLLIRNAGGGSVSSNVLLGQMFVETATTSTDTTGLTGTIAANDTVGTKCSSWDTNVGPPLTHTTVSASGWQRAFTSFGPGYNWSIGGTIYTGGNPPADGIGAGQAGIGWKVDNGTGTSNFVRCNLTTTTNFASVGFVFNTSMTGTSTNIHDFFALKTVTNGYQASFQFSDKGGVSPCGAGAIGVQLEAFDSINTHRSGTCISINSNTIYWGEINIDNTLSTANFQGAVYDQNCAQVGATISVNWNSGGVADNHLSVIEFGDDPNTGVAAGKVTYESNMMIFTGTSAQQFPMMCTR